MNRRSSTEFRWIVLGLTLAAGCARAISDEQQDQFRQAQQRFEEAVTPDDYLRAAAAFQQLRDDGVRSGIVLYNQGNAYAHAGQRGRAIACYLEAQRYRPRDVDLQANLRSVAGANDLELPRAGPAAMLFWQDWFSYPAKLRASLLLTAATVVVALAACWFARRWLTRLAIGLVVLSVIACTSAAYDAYRFDVVSQGVVIGPDVMPRKGPAESFAPASAEPLSDGKLLRVIEQRDAWIRIVDREGHQGWLPADAVVVF